MPRRHKRRSFGEIEHLPSGKFRARYTGPDGNRYSKTLAYKTDAEGWLAAENRLINLETWTSPPRAPPRPKRAPPQSASGSKPSTTASNAAPNQ